jgi:Animal haem peroxidase
MTARHGSESFYIEGEGLVNTQVGGRSGTDPDPITDPVAPAASFKPTAAVALDGGAPPFRFSRVGPKGTPLTAATTAKLARSMIGPGGGSGDVPAGYTYLGQFVDHDLTMDVTSVTLGEDVRPADLLQARSPSLDLDSLYGAGPADVVSAKFYEADGLHLKTGDSIAIGSDGVKTGHDLPRAGTGPNRKARRQALIPDPRNDENLIVAQTHLAMIHFHNRVVDKLPSSIPVAQRFRRARKVVTLHYQWLVRHDFLPRIVRENVLADVFDNGRKLVEPDAAPTSVPTMPVEFSVAAFRLGHSMIRDSYNWNRRFAGSNGFLDYMFQFSALGGDLGGEARLLSNWIADWRRMYDFPGGGRPTLAAPGNNVNRAMRVDTVLTDPLKNLPASTFGGNNIPFDDQRRNLAFRNLTRGNMLKLASGQQLAERLTDLGVTTKPLTRAQILGGSGGAKVTGLTDAEKDALVARTPLWFYILREAETGDGRLRGVGARIVAETFHRAIEGSRFSLLREPDFQPKHGRDATTFEMTDLLFFAFAGKKSGINPLGGS